MILDAFYLSNKNHIDIYANCEPKRFSVNSQSHQLEFDVIDRINIIRVIADKEKVNLNICNSDMRLFLANRWIYVDSIYYQEKGRFRVMEFKEFYRDQVETLKHFKDSLKIQYWIDQR